MATTPTGVTVPAGADPFDPQGDMVDLANSLRSRIVVPVPNVTARTALVEAIDWTPSTAEPLRVCRADAPAGRRDEITYNGTDWIPVATGGSDWETLPVGAAFTTNSLVEVRRGPDGDGRMRGALRQNAGNFGTGRTDNVFTLPPTMRPTKITRVPVVSWIAGSTVEYSTATQAVLEILTTGVCRTYTTGATTALILDPARWDTL
jgi:hypothetical protein